MTGCLDVDPGGQRSTWKLVPWAVGVQVSTALSEMDPPLLAKSNAVPVYPTPLTITSALPDGTAVGDDCVPPARAPITIGSPLLVPNTVISTAAADPLPTTSTL